MRDTGNDHPARYLARKRPLAGAFVLLMCHPITAWAHDTGRDGHGPAAATEGTHVDLYLAPVEAPVLVLVHGHAYRVAVHSRNPVDLHLHGYDLTAGADADQPAIFGFVAEHTGRFPIETHGGDDLLGRESRPVAFIEVRKGAGQ